MPPIPAHVVVFLNTLRPRRIAPISDEALAEGEPDVPVDEAHGSGPSHNHRDHRREPRIARHDEDHDPHTEREGELHRPRDGMSKSRPQTPQLDALASWPFA